MKRNMKEKKGRLRTFRNTRGIGVLRVTITTEGRAIFPGVQGIRGFYPIGILLDTKGPPRITRECAIETKLVIPTIGFPVTTPKKWMV